MIQNPNNQNKFWLENLSKIKDTKLKNIILPGTHNSHSYKINPRNIYGNNKLFKFFSSVYIFDNFIKKWTLNQDYSIYQQLIMGVRWIDIDVTFDIKNNQWKAVHSFENGDLNDMLEQIIQFINETNEIILVVLTPRNISPYHIKILNQYVNSKLENYTIKNTLTNILNTNLSELIKSKQRLLLFSEGKNSIYNRKLSQENWLNTNNYKYGYEKSKNILLNMERNNFKFNHLSWVLTGRTKDIIFSFFNQGLKSLNNKFIKQFDIFYENFNQDLKEKTNIISFDFITINLINKIIQLNF